MLQGCPLILQSDNGKEFVAAVIKELKELFPDCKIVNCRPRHPQSQGSVERANQDVEKMMTQWMNDNNSRKWSIGCHVAQFQKNNRYYRSLRCKKSTLLLRYGQKCRVGLSDLPIQKELIDKLSTEEELDEALNSITIQNTANSSKSYATPNKTELIMSLVSSQTDLLLTNLKQQIRLLVLQNRRWLIKQF